MGVSHEQASIVNLSSGELITKFDYELQNVIKNCKDLNTAAKEKRKITLTVEFIPSDDRKRISVNGKVRATLAGDAPVEDQMIVSQKGQGFVDTGKQLLIEDYAKDVAELNQKTEGE